VHPAGRPHGEGGERAKSPAKAGCVTFQTAAVRHNVGWDREASLPRFPNGSPDALFEAWASSPASSRASLGHSRASPQHASSPLHPPPGTVRAEARGLPEREGGGERHPRTGQQSRRGDAPGRVSNPVGARRARQARDRAVRP
jgi:hypothetical protein